LPIATKLEKNLEISNLENIKRFQQEIGSIIYTIIFTRPDLIFSINYLARFMSNPSLEHYNYLNNYIWGYLVNTKDFGLDLSLNKLDLNKLDKSNLNLNKVDFPNKQSKKLDKLNLIGSSDSDWGGDINTRKSTTGNIFYLNNPNSSNNINISISWLSKLQKTVAISSAEAEYIALKEATKESLYLQLFIKELITSPNLDLNKELDLFNSLKIIKTDSQSAIELAKNPIFHARTKHVDITYHFVRENLLENKIDLIYESTSTLLADNLTKPTSYPKFKQFIKEIGLVDLK
jgi:hypothetical protein